MEDNPRNKLKSSKKIYKWLEKLVKFHKHSKGLGSSHLLCNKNTALPMLRL